MRCTKPAKVCENPINPYLTDSMDVKRYLAQISIAMMDDIWAYALWMA